MIPQTAGQRARAFKSIRCMVHSSLVISSFFSASSRSCDPGNFTRRGRLVHAPIVRPGRLNLCYARREARLYWRSRAAP